MAFAACTGVRRGEMLALRWMDLRWMDVDMKYRRLHLRETKNGALRILPAGNLFASQRRGKVVALGVCF